MAAPGERGYTVSKFHCMNLMKDELRDEPVSDIDVLVNSSPGEMASNHVFLHI